MAQVELAERAVRYLTDHGVRITKARRMVITCLVSHPGPRSAAELDTAMRRRIPVSSIYRNLQLLANAGLLTKYVDGDGIAKYELSERVTGDHHHHFVCLRCGRTDEVAISDELERVISRLIDTAAAAHDYELTGHRLELEGVCDACRTAQ